MNITNFSEKSGETGKLIEALLGGDSVQPKADLKLVDTMYSEGKLVNREHNKNPSLKEQIKYLPEAIKKLLILSEQHKNSVYPHIQEKIREQMFKIKKFFKHELLFEALLRYTINALPDNFTPWEPGPVGINATKRNEFITELQGEICEKFEITDYNKVRFFNTINSPLDILYSTDGCFVADGSLFPDKKRRVLPIDITGNINKAEKKFNISGSAILYLDMTNLDDEALEKYCSEFAKQIKNILEKTQPDKTLNGFRSKFDSV